MKRKAVVTVFLLMGMAAIAQASSAHEFVGAKKCSLCHKTEAAGQQYAKWLSSNHAKAYETLGTARAKEVGATIGVAEPQKDGKCLRCHSTAYYFSDIKVSEQIPVEEGVSCESCHGPGADYMKKSVMQDRQAAIELGLIIPDEKTCRQCHGAGGPVKEDFNFEKSWEKIKHPKPSVSS